MVSKTGGDILATELNFSSASVSFGNGETTKTVSIPLNAIPATKSRTIVLSLSGSSLGSPSTMVITIATKDTTAPALTATFGAPDSSGLSVVTGSATDSGTGINRVEITNKNIAGTSGPTVISTADGAYSTNIQLQHGANSLAVTAYDNSGNKTVKTATVNFTNTALTTRAGTYTGLLISSVTASNDTSGLLTVTVTGTAGITGKLVLGGLSVSFSGALDNDGVVRFKPTNATTFDVIDKTEFDSYLGSLSIVVTTKAVGTLKTSALGSVLATSQAEKQATAASPILVGSATSQKYTLSLPASVAGDAYPQGDGYASITVFANGSVAATGVLADGTAFSTSGKLHEASGSMQIVPLQRNLYRNKGSLATELVFDLNPTPDSVPDVAPANGLWIRPALPRARYFPAGWETGLAVTGSGSRYTVPLTGSVLLGLGTTSPNAQLVFADGGISSAIARFGNVSATNVFTNANVSADAALKLSITKSTGLFTGTFTHPTSGVQTFNGIIIQEGANAKGFGFFLTPPTATTTLGGQSGGVTLMPRP